MKYNFRVKHNNKYDIDLVDMKCLECNYEEEIELDVLLELSDIDNEVTPILTCPKCNHDLLVPKDVYDQISKKARIYALFLQSKQANIFGVCRRHTRNMSTVCIF